MYKEYEQVGMTYRIKQYIQKLPEVSNKLRCKLDKLNFKWVMSSL